MDKLLGSQVRKQRGKAKKKPIKVVYIPNPMKVTTSASQFRTLVQLLTGQDSDPTDLESADYFPAPAPDHSTVHQDDHQLVVDVGADADVPQPILGGDDGCHVSPTAIPGPAAAAHRHNCNEHHIPVAPDHPPEASKVQQAQQDANVIFNDQTPDEVFCQQMNMQAAAGFDDDEFNSSCPSSPLVFPPLPFMDR